MKKYNSISYIRFIAMCMIIFDHLVGMRYPDFIVTKLISKTILAPLHIIQYFGALGVVLFYLISGFLFKSDSLKKTLKKIFEIWLICLISTVIFYLFQIVLWKFGIDTYWHSFSYWEWFNGATLLGYITGDGDMINGTTWFLIPLFLYYLIATFMNKIAKKKDEQFSLKIIFFCMIVILSVLLYLKKIVDIPLSYYFVFTFIPLTGRLIKMLIEKKTSIIFCFSSLCLCYGAFLCGIRYFASSFYVEDPYLVSYIYGLLIFTVYVLLEDRLKENCVIEKCNKYSLSMYLNHMLWGSLLLSFNISWSLYKVTIVPLLLCFICYLNYNFIIKKVNMIGMNAKERSVYDKKNS